MEHGDDNSKIIFWLHSCGRSSRDSNVSIYWTAMNMYAQNTTMSSATQQQNQTDDRSPSLSTDQTIEGWITSFDLENCNSASSGENSYFILKPGYQVIL